MNQQQISTDFVSKEYTLYAKLLDRAIQSAQEESPLHVEAWLTQIEKLKTIVTESTPGTPIDF